MTPGFLKKVDTKSKLDSVISVLAGDHPENDKSKGIVNEFRVKGLDLYSTIMHCLTFKKFTEEDAKKLWDEILVHKLEMSTRMNRNVGIRVAALDYLSNEKNIINQLRIIDSCELDKIMVFVNTDGLTGLYNHRFFQETVGNFIT
ncbi:MAG: hypothetical protein KAS39_03145, partial [Actinomycetia bacterium]|nr:hypothetical protein [Actinomycetes bacterium]